MSRVILHSDANNFYASVECLHRPEYRDKPLAVGGDPEARHGIILAKNMLAKKFDIKTGEAIWQAKQKCPELVVVPPDFSKYLRFSKMAREIYADYTDRIEPFGIDENWLDVTGSVHLFGSGEEIAEEIRQRVKDELGITVSIGVSFSKIFAKLGSDMKKPDAITVISEDNFKEKVWPLPVEDLLYVGRATTRKLHTWGIHTIGQLAQLDVQFLTGYLGKWGEVLHLFANGLDSAPVSYVGQENIIKSIGNSTTTPRDLICFEDVKMVVYVLSESVGMRLREQGFQCRNVAISVRDNELFSFDRQMALKKPTTITSEIADAALAIFKKNYDWIKPIRSIGVRVTDFCSGDMPIQMDLFSDESKREKKEQLDKTIDWLRGRFGNGIIERAVLLQDRKLTGLDPKTNHMIHPVGYFK